MKQIRKIIFLYLIIFVFLVTILGTYCLEKNNNKIKPIRCELSEEYLKWEKLSDEEKQNTIMPAMCKMESSSKPSMMLFGTGEDELPSFYDGRDQNYISSLKNQIDTNGCWSFSSTSAMEFYANKYFNLNKEFSTRHMVYSTTREFLNDEINDYGFNKVPQDGGNFLMSSNYFINSQGPVLETEMPFENNENTLNISEIQNKTVQFDTNDVILNFDETYGEVCSTTEIKDIKKYVYEYGSVAISTYMTYDPNYYNLNTNAFYYNGIYDSNHAVLIVGWDDNYSKDNFVSTNKPSKNGAWIVQNSYGTSFGDNGYYYISYEDIHVCNIYMAIKNVDEEIEDNSYIHDNLGFNVFYGYSDSTAYSMNVFTKEVNKKEEIKEVTFGSGGIGTYELYYVEGNGKNKTISEMTLIGSGDLESMGYHTHKLDEPLLLDNSVADFSIVIYYDMLNTNYPLAISAPIGTFYQYVDITSDKSFISPNGQYWDDLAEVDGGVISSIKVFTDDVDDSVIEDSTTENEKTDEEKKEEQEEIKIITSNVYNIDQEKLLIYVQPNTSENTFKNNVSGIKSFTHTGNVYTGLKVDNYTIIVLGDVNGDGYAKMNDVMMISSYIVNGIGLTDNYKLAADVNLDSFIKMNDVMKISNYIVEGGSI